MKKNNKEIDKKLAKAQMVMLSSVFLIISIAVIYEVVKFIAWLKIALI